MNKCVMLLTSAAVCMAAGACASSEDVRALRRPPLPPRFVALADTGSPLHEGVAVYEILGAPEFKLFDGGALYTTRPTRAEVARMHWAWLADAGMLAEDVAHARYLLTVTFEDMRGPNVIPFTDKRAGATVTYKLEERERRRTVFEHSYQTARLARMPGVTPEMVRAAVASGVIGAAAGAALNELDEASDAIAGAVELGADIGLGSALFATSHETLLWDQPEALYDEWSAHAARGVGVGASVGFLAAAGAGAVPGRPSDFEAGLVGAGAGVVASLASSAPRGRKADAWDSAEQMGSLARRAAVRPCAAWRGSASTSSCSACATRKCCRSAAPSLATNSIPMAGEAQC